MKKQIIVIHGGETFDTYEEYFSFLKNLEIDFERIRLREKGWKKTLGEKLGENFEVILPEMPNALNAKHAEWKIMLDKFIPFLNNNVILIGHSLGGIFLAKYLSENNFPKKIAATFLISAPFGDKNAEPTLGDFAFNGDLAKLQEQGGRIFLCYSKDDLCVPLADLEKYKQELLKAETMIFEDRGHFNQPEFPELVEKLKNIF
ncbi:MAG: alpha/beta hydrolase [Candidatus Paceibacterota bacterium]|jgi:hypothetical protein